MPYERRQVRNSYSYDDFLEMEVGEVVYGGNCLLHLPPYNSSKCCTNLINVSNLQRVYYSFIPYYGSSNLQRNFQYLLRLNRVM